MADTNTVSGLGSARPGVGRSVRLAPYARNVFKEPTRIDLLELDIDLRISDLWREALDVSEWNLEVVAAFIRAAYGKGYCDALTEEFPGELCMEHGYRLPERQATTSGWPERDAA